MLNTTIPCSSQALKRLWVLNGCATGRNSIEKSQNTVSFLYSAISIKYKQGEHSLGRGREGNVNMFRYYTFLLVQISFSQSLSAD